MYGNQASSGAEPIIVSPTSIELDAEWSWWTRITWAFVHSRHQAAVVAYVAIVATIWITNVQAHNTVILSIAFAFIAGIAVSTEWIAGKFYGSVRKKGTVAPCDATAN